MTSIGFLIAILAAYWVFSDSRKHGHESTTALLWAAGTFLMMIVFLPLYLIFGRKPKITTSRGDTVIDIDAVPVEETMYCPMCASKVKEDFKTCPYCSHTLKPKCENCGKELKREWKTCPYCEAPAGPK